MNASNCTALATRATYQCSALITVAVYLSSRAYPGGMIGWMFHCLDGYTKGGWR